MGSMLKECLSLNELDISTHFIIPKNSSLIFESGSKDVEKILVDKMKKKWIINLSHKENLIFILIKII